MEKLLLIAEKPSLRRDLEKTYNSHKNEIPYEIVFTNLVGHCCRLMEPKEYAEWEDTKWKDLNLPMIPKTWKVGVIPNMKSVYSTIIKTFKSGNFDGIIAAEDPEREGNYIQYLLEQEAGLNKVKTYRIWLNEGLTDDAILKAYQNMTDFHNDETQKRLTDAAILRGRNDWLLGMNLTVGSTVKFGTLLNVGKIKSCVINMVYLNSMAIDNFIPTTNYNLISEFDTFSAINIDLEDKASPVKYITEKDALNVAAKIGNKFKVIDSTEETVKTYAPKLYKLSTIQSDAGKLYGYTPDETLEIIQSLYDNKLLTYPRTGCDAISTSIAKTLPTLLNSVKAFPDLKAALTSVSSADISKIAKIAKYTNDAAVKKDAHTAILPTSKIPNISALSDKEKNILYLVYSRLVAICYPPLIEKKKSILLDNNGYIFKANGKTILDKGYINFTKQKITETELPDFSIGEELTNLKYRVEEKITTPPTRYTQSTLIDDMNNAQKFVTDNSFKKILTEIEGIGTPATQAPIIKEIIKDGYVDLKKGKSKELQLYISEKGKFYCETLKGLSILNPAFVAEMEINLKRVSDGDASFNECEKYMIEYLNTLLNEINSKPNVNIPQNNFAPSESIGKCPDCGKAIVKRNWGYGCSGYKEGCKFGISNEYSSKKISESQVKKLLNKGITDTINGFKGTKGEFSMKLKLCKENGITKVKYCFDK